MSGRVEIFHNNSWGTVCDNDWSFSDALVVCHQLGFESFYKILNNGFYGEGKRSTWIDGFDCNSTEDNVTTCSHNGWGEHNCTHAQDAGVACGKKLCLSSLFYHK